MLQGFVIESILALLAAVPVFFRSRSDLALEVLALRQQVAVLKRRRPRPRLNSLDRLFWTTLRRAWTRWAEVLAIVKPETVVGWHRAGFRLYWRWRSRASRGRPKLSAEVRGLIRRLAEENPTWGAPKIHGELMKLGFVVSERSVSRYLRRIQRRGEPGKRWLAFLQNHREVIVAFDFFTVPTVTFQVLYCFFVIAHGRRKILHCNVTRHPTADWVVQQLREAFPEATPYRYVILDRDSKFDAEVITFLKATGLKPKRTSLESPWQNGIAERWVGSCRREILDHVIPLNEAHLRRLVGDYVSYYHEDRTHDSLAKDTPNRRPVEKKPCPEAVVIPSARLGGLHHRYSWREAA
jgi:putative transposase